MFQLEKKILLVDDEEDILEFLGYNLRKEKYLVKTALNGVEALKIMESFTPHLVVLDIMMPEMDGIEVCEQIRQNSKYQDVLVAFLTAKSESYTQVTALETGGDDYITKPIKPSVFLSRVKAILRRHKLVQQNENSEIKAFGDLVISREDFNVKIKGKDVILAKKEFELLSLLVEKPGRLYKRQEILNKVWGPDVIVGDRTIDVHVRKLRKKIGDHFIVTVKGVGYKFDF